MQCAGWSLCLGWCLNLIPPTDDCSGLPDLTLDLTDSQYSSWVLACASTPDGEFVLCFVSLFRLSSYISVIAHPSVLINGTNRAMYVFR